MTPSYPKVCPGRRTAGMGLAAALLLGSVPASPAHAQLMVVGVDRKFDGTSGKRDTLEPGHGQFLVFDLKDPATPALIGELALENSLAGPRTNLAVTLD